MVEGSVLGAAGWFCGQLCGEHALVPSREGMELDALLRMCVRARVWHCLGSGLSSRTWDVVGSFIISEIPAWPPVSKAQSTTELWKGSPVPPRHPSLKVALGSLPFAYFFCETLRKCVIGCRAFKENLPPIWCEFFESFPSEPGLARVDWLLPRTSHGWYPVHCGRVNKRALPLVLELEQA